MGRFCMPGQAGVKHVRLTVGSAIATACDRSPKQPAGSTASYPGHFSNPSHHVCTLKKSAPNWDLQVSMPVGKICPAVTACSAAHRSMCAPACTDRRQFNQWSSAVIQCGSLLHPNSLVTLLHDEGSHSADEAVSNQQRALPGGIKAWFPSLWDIVSCGCHW